MEEKHERKLKCELYNDSMHEEWRDVKGYEGLYQVSNKGNVKSIPHLIKANISGGTRITKGKEKKARKGWHGYKTISLCKEGELKTCLLHRLVAEAFVDNPNNLPAVNHIDGDKDNNSCSNLEWCTNADNSRHAVESGLITTAKKVRCIETNTVYRCSKDAEISTGINARNIRSACQGRYKTSGGYHWEYAT